MIGHEFILFSLVQNYGQLQSGGEFCRHITTPKQKQKKVKTHGQSLLVVNVNRIKQNPLELT